MVVHDCATIGCTGPALRAHTERLDQGLPAQIRYGVDPDVDRRIRATAQLLLGPSSVANKDKP